MHEVREGFLTNISPTQSFAERPWPEVYNLVVDGQTLNAALKTPICTCCSNQPVSTRRSAQIQLRAESNLSVLTLKERIRRNCSMDYSETHMKVSQLVRR